MRRFSWCLGTFLTLVLLLPEPAAGYVGPGAGLAAIGAALAFVGAILLGVFGFVWYPVKRLYRAVTRKGKVPLENVEP